jgi:hypothetical protein
VVDGIDGECSTNGEKRNAYRLMVRKPKERRTLGRPRRKWVDSIIMDFGELVWGDVDWTELVWLRTGAGGELL